MEELPEWKLYSLELDKAGEEISRFFNDNGHDITRIPRNNLTGILQISSKRDLERGITKNLDNNKRAMAVYGDGRFHHCAYGLCKFAEKFSKDYCYIHIDHHHDAYGPNKRGLIACADFTRQLGKFCKGIKKQANMIFIGSKPPKTLRWLIPRRRMKYFFEKQLRQNFEKGGLKDLEELLKDSPKHCYLTMDLDVMAEDEILASYDRGTLRKEELLNILEIIKETKEIIGADALGYTLRPHDTGLPRTQITKLCQDKALRQKSLNLYKSIVDTIIDNNQGGQK